MDASDTLLRGLMDGGHKLIADAVGVTTACELALHFGGERLHIAKHPPASSRIVQALGMTAAEQLAAAYGGDYLDIPLGFRVLAVWLDRGGMDRSEIARRLRRGRNHVMAVLNEVNGRKADLHQPSLFSD